MHVSILRYVVNTRCMYTSVQKIYITEYNLLLGNNNIFSNNYSLNLIFQNIKMTNYDMIIRLFCDLCPVVTKSSVLILVFSSKLDIKHYRIKSYEYYTKLMNKIYSNIESELKFENIIYRRMILNSNNFFGISIFFFFFCHLQNIFGNLIFKMKDFVP